MVSNEWPIADKTFAPIDDAAAALFRMNLFPFKFERELSLEGSSKNV